MPVQVTEPVEPIPDISARPLGGTSMLARTPSCLRMQLAWYSSLAKLTDQNCRTPKLIHFENSEDGVLLVMEDLNPAGFPIRKTEVLMPDIKLCLKWLAFFHAKFMKEEPADLWQIHLPHSTATEQQQFRSSCVKNLQIRSTPKVRSIDQSTVPGTRFTTKDNITKDGGVWSNEISFSQVWNETISWSTSFTLIDYTNQNKIIIFLIIL